MKNVIHYMSSLFIYFFLIGNFTFLMPQEEEEYYYEEVPEESAAIGSPSGATPANDQSIQMPPPPTEEQALAPTPEIVAEPLTGPDILQISEGKDAGLMPSGDPQVGKIYEDSEKLAQERQGLIKSMHQTANTLKEKFTDQEAKLDDFYQDFGFNQGQVQELFSPIKEQKLN